LVHPDDVVPRLRAFVEAEAAAAGPNSQLLFASTLTAATKAATAGAALSSRGTGGGPGRPLGIKNAAAKEQEYWQQLTQVRDQVSMHTQTQYSQARGGGAAYSSCGRCEGPPPDTHPQSHAGMF
jgi:hypothetical protein